MMHAAKILLKDGTVIQCTPRFEIAEAQADMRRLESAFHAESEESTISKVSDMQGRKLLHEDAQTWSDYADLCKDVASDELLPRGQAGAWVEAVARAVRQVVKVEQLIAKAAAMI